MPIKTYLRENKGNIMPTICWKRADLQGFPVVLYQFQDTKKTVIYPSVPGKVSWHRLDRMLRRCGVKEKKHIFSESEIISMIGKGLRLYWVAEAIEYDVAFSFLDNPNKT